jgi:methionyl aminopeptidase
MQEGQVFTVEPFLSLGAIFAEDGDKDNWTLFGEPSALTVQFEHTLVVTRNGPVVLTLAD